MPLMSIIGQASAKTIYLVSYPRSGSTLLRKYFSLLQGRPQRSVYEDDIIDEFSEPLTRALDDIDLVKSHQLPGGHEDVVYLVRDGRNATLSFLFMKFLMGNHRFSALHEVHEALCYIDAGEGSWARHVEAALSSGDGRRIVFLKYEDLILRPGWFLQRLLEFAQTPLPSSGTGPMRARREEIRFLHNQPSQRLSIPAATGLDLRFDQAPPDRGLLALRVRRVVSTLFP